ARGRRGRGREVTDDGGGSDVEAEHPQLVPAVLGDLVRPPRRHPDPVDLDLAVELLQRAGGLVLQHVGERTGGAGQRHVDDDVPLVHVDAVDQAEIDDVDAQFGVDDVLEGVGDLFQDRKSTRLNSSHVKISYVVFCLKKKKNLH